MYSFVVWLTGVECDLVGRRHASKQLSLPPVLPSRGAIASFYLSIRINNTSHSGKKPYRQVGMNRVMILRSLVGLMVSTLAVNAIDVGLNPALGTLFPIFIVPVTHTHTYAHTRTRTHARTLRYINNKIMA